MHLSGRLGRINLFTTLAYHVDLYNTLLLLYTPCLLFSIKSLTHIPLDRLLSQLLAHKSSMRALLWVWEGKNQRKRNMSRKVCFCRSKEAVSGRKEWGRILNAAERLSNTRTSFILVTGNLRKSWDGEQDCLGKWWSWAWDWREAEQLDTSWSRDVESRQSFVLFLNYFKPWEVWESMKMQMRMIH